MMIIAGVLYLFCRGLNYFSCPSFFFIVSLVWLHKSLTLCHSHHTLPKPPRPHTPSVIPVTLSRSHHVLTPSVIPIFVTLCRVDHVFSIADNRFYFPFHNLDRIDARKLEEWARVQNLNSLFEFSSKEGEVEGILKDIAERAGRKGEFSYSRFFAVGLFHLLELANAIEPTTLDKLCAALNINKRSVDWDFDVYRILLSKLVQAKKLFKEYIDR
ncbi:hypothetical protein Fmac_000733 [Flemingia macrophylla]|uniref:Uncharacterized protein n=1 Tax=Flemingia macrophylla TaxID=520843 RepID=A0ABD1NFR9_9FABA